MATVDGRLAFGTEIRIYPITQTTWPPPVDADIGDDTTPDWQAEVTDLGLSGITRDPVDVSHDLLTVPAGYALGEYGVLRKIIAGKVTAPGEISVDFNYNADTRTAPAKTFFAKQPPVNGPDGQVYLIFAPLPGEVTGPGIIVEGFVSDFSWGAPMEDKLAGSLTVTLGDVLNFHPSSLT